MKNKNRNRYIHTYIYVRMSDVRFLHNERQCFFCDNVDTVIYVMTGNVEYSIFASNSEKKASKLLENLEEILHAMSLGSSF